MGSLVFLFLLQYFVSWVQSVPPSMTSVNGTKTIAENDISFRGVMLFDFSTSCTGGSGSYSFTYTYDPASTSSVINAQSNGKISLQSSATLDYESVAQYTLWAKCKDTTSNEFATTQGVFHLLVGNINEAPVCTCTSKTLTINAPALVGTIVPGDNSISVTDADSGTMRWSVLGGTGKDFFSIDPSIGQPATLKIKVKQQLDYNNPAIKKQPCLDLIIEIMDAGGLSTTASTTICVNDNTSSQLASSTVSGPTSDPNSDSTSDPTHLSTTPPTKQKNGSASVGSPTLYLIALYCIFIILFFERVFGVHI